MKILNIMKYFNNRCTQNILLADDNLKDLRREKAFFRQKGLRVFTATSGEEVLTICNREKINLIMLSLHLHGLSGDEVCRRIRTDDRLMDVSIIMVLPSANPEEKKISIKAGANDFITKPVNDSRLNNVIFPRVSRLLNVSPRKKMRMSVRLDRNNRGSGFGNMLNLSMTGMLIETYSPFKVSDLLPLSFQVPRENNILELEGRIIREDKQSTEGMYRYGVRFLELCMREKKFMKKLIEQS